MSFLKYYSDADGGGRGNLFWGRADDDGAPFRGSTSPMLKQEEFEELVHRVYDTKSGTFDTSDSTQQCGGRTFAQVIDRIGNGLYRCLRYESEWHKTEAGPVMFVFIIWSEPYQELSPQHYNQGGIPNANNGRTARISPPPVIR